VDVALDIPRRLREHLKSQQDNPNQSAYGDGIVAGLKLALRVVDDAMGAASRRSG